MLHIRAIVRPEKAAIVMKALLDNGFPAITKTQVHGRGKQRGLVVGNITYDEISKTSLMLVINDCDKDIVVQTIIESARTEPRGQFGDGKIFISPVLEAWSISNGLKGL
ncbi:MAG TPA: P-II family nitrogen regulator [Bacteroidales bacterium]|nr:P-II family nitrogen regulator [Bacteroidales bacterium]